MTDKFKEYIIKHIQKECGDKQGIIIDHINKTWTNIIKTKTPNGQAFPVIFDDWETFPHCSDLKKFIISIHEFSKDFDNIDYSTTYGNLVNALPDVIKNNETYTIYTRICLSFEIISSKTDDSFFVYDTLKFRISIINGIKNSFLFTYAFKIKPYTQLRYPPKVKISDLIKRIQSPDSNLTPATSQYKQYILN